MTSLLFSGYRRVIKNCMTTRVLTLWRVHVTSLTTSVLTMRFLIEIMFILKPIKSHFKGSYNKQNLTLVIISYETYETRRRLAVSFNSNEMITRGSSPKSRFINFICNVRSSICNLHRFLQLLKGCQVPPLHLPAQLVYPKYAQSSLLQGYWLVMEER